MGGAAPAKAPVDITLIDRSNHHLFQPLLYQVATAGLAAPSIAAPLRHILRKQRNVTVLMGEVPRIDTGARRVTLGERSIDYDYLLVASGATHAYFGHDDWEHFAPGLKTLDDAFVIRRRVLDAFERAEAATERRRARRLPHLRGDRRRPDRRRARRHAGRDRAPHAGATNSATSIRARRACC